MRVGAFEVDEAIRSLRRPLAIATLRPWLDAGNVGTLVHRRLVDVLGARDLGELARPGEFFDFTRYRPMTRYEGEERRFVVPNTRMSFARRRDGSDLLLLDVLEPHAHAEEYLDSLVEVLSVAGVTAHWRIGAWFGGVPHTRPLRVSLTLAGKQVDARTRRETRSTTRYEGPTSIMSLLGARLEESGVANNALMLQIPQYVQIEEDFTAAAAMLEALGEALDAAGEFDEAVLGMKARGKGQYAQLSRMVAGDPELGRVLERLEEAYDAERRASAEEHAPLAPEIERFLGEITRQMDGEGED